jgi:hypothetical protein
LMHTDPQIGQPIQYGLLLHVCLPVRGQPGSVQTR